MMKRYCLFITIDTKTRLVVFTFYRMTKHQYVYITYDDETLLFLHYIRRKKILLFLYIKR